MMFLRFKTANSFCRNVTGCSHFTSRVFSVIDLGAGVDATDAPAWALVEGVEAMYLAAAGLLAAAAGLALLAVIMDRQRKGQIPASPSVP